MLRGLRIRAEHLAYVRGAQALGGAAQGAEVGSEELRFEPRPVAAGDYLVEVAAGASAPRLFQCLFYPLALAGGGQLMVRGGTHLSEGPTYHDLGWAWLHALGAYGFSAEFKLRCAGFAPEGGGEFRATIHPRAGDPPHRVDLPARGTLREVEVVSFVGGLPLAAAEEQLRAAVQVLRANGVHCNEEKVPVPVAGSAGGAVLIKAQFENTLAGFQAASSRGSAPRDVGQQAAQKLVAFLKGAGALDEHLGDQILIPAGLLAAQRLGPSPGVTRFTAAAVTPALGAHATLIEKFLPVRVEIGPESAVQVLPA